MTPAASSDQTQTGARGDFHPALILTTQPSRPPQTISAQVVAGAGAARTQRQELIGSSTATSNLISHALEAASVNWTLVITGETGTGKTTIARFIHDHGPRARQPFVAVNCAAIPQNLVESELFGHVRGAFTGAITDQEGAFEKAHGGTLFFDEIGDLTLEAQAKLLTAIEQKTFARVGSHKLVTVDVRIIAATHRHLEEMMAAGTFRRDLYHRISFLEIEAPSLSARREDIPALAQHLASRCAHDLDIPAIALDHQVTAWLRARPFPGNIRDLHRTVSRLTLAAARDRSAQIEMAHALKLQPDANSAPADVKSGNAQVVETLQFIEIKEGEDLKQAQARITLAILESTVKKYDHNLTKAGERIGVFGGHLSRRIKRLRREVGGTPSSPLTVSVC